MATKYQFYNGSNDSGCPIRTDVYIPGQTFTPEIGHTITSVKLLLWRYGSPGTCYVDIYEVDEDHFPTGASKCQGSFNANLLTTNTAGQWKEITLGAGANLTYDTEYVIVVSAPDGGETKYVMWSRDTTDPAYTRGIAILWIETYWLAQPLVDYNFEEWGDPSFDPPTVQTNNADSVGHQSAKLHGTLPDDGGEACEVRFQYGKTAAYGTDTEWQEGKVSEDTFEQLITGLDPDETYHFRAQAKNTVATASGTDTEFTTSSLPPTPGAMKKAQITHPALKTVRIFQFGQQVATFDALSNPDQSYIESGLTIQIPTPSTVEVTTLANQTWEFNIPEH